MRTALFVAFALMGCLSVARGDDPLKGGDLSKHFSGPTIDPANLEGKVVLVEYFIFGCGPCKKSLPGLVKAIEEHGSNGNFAIVVSVQGKADEKGLAYLQAQVPTIPVYRGINLPHAKSAKGYPNAHLFDHRGQLVASGGPGSLLKKVGALVAEVPSLEPTPFLADFETRECGTEIGALRDAKGDAVETLRALQAAGRGQDPRAGEAKEIVSRVRQWLDEERSRLDFVSKRRPAEVAWQAQELFDRFEEFDREHDKKLNAILKAVKEQRGVLRYLTARRDFILARESADPETTAGFDKRARGELDAVLRDEKAAASVKDAAEKLRREFVEER